MGCNTSTSMGADGEVKVHVRRKVSVHMGNAVKVVKSDPLVIFIFGGPSSKKGKLANDIAQTFGLKLINVSEMIFDEMAKKLKPEDESEEKAKNIRATLQANIKMDPLSVKLIWVTREISKIIDENPKGGYLIDMMPNLRSLVNSEGFVKECTNEMKLFEGKYPISFAINFAVPHDKYAKKKEVECAKPEVKSGKDDKKKDGAGGKSDEADGARTKRRAMLFEKSVKPFLDYFQKSDRLLTINTAQNKLDSIWGKICEIFDDMSLSNLQNVETVIVFCYNEQEVNQINIGSYYLDKILLRDHIQDSQEPVEKVLKTLSKVINSSHPATKAFVVDVTGTCLTEKNNIDFSKKSIVFVDNESAPLENYVFASHKTAPCSLSFKAISSSENEVCLFPGDVNTVLAKRISLFLTDCREV